MKKKKTASVLIVSIILLLAPTAGCGQSADMYNPYAETGDGIIDILPESVPLSRASAIFTIPVPTATGKNTVKNNIAEIDVSNAKDGYVMVRYLKKTGKELRVIITADNKTPYIYRLNPDGEYDVFPISDGNGYYRITVYENVFGNKYSTILEAARNIRLNDEFAPFIRPNQYVNYDSGSKTTKKAAELTKSSKNETEKITAIYNYVIKNITYDRQLASTIKSGYIPDVDKVLEKGKGICFDYAAVMTAMLRSQGIPTKLVIGYTGKVYHAWISTYSYDTGWVDGVVYFDGKHWNLMDPTLASSAGSNSEVWKYINNENNYSAKYFY